VFCEALSRGGRLKGLYIVGGCKWGLFKACPVKSIGESLAQSEIGLCEGMLLLCLYFIFLYDTRGWVNHVLNILKLIIFRIY